MKQAKLIVSMTLLLLTAFAQGGEAVDTSSLKEEFNISKQWREGMSWYEFLKIRNKLKRAGLVKYVDKIEQQKMALAAGLAIAKTYVASREKEPFIDKISHLKSYVAKLSHLSLSQGLIIVKKGKNMITGERITPEEVQKNIFKYLKKKPRKVESWTLHQVPPGFIIQEYIPKRNEAKIQTIWGKVVIGEWRGGESTSSRTPVWGRYDRDGNRVDGERNRPEWWSKAVEAAEQFAEGTDALHIDFLIRENGELLLNELEIWVESDWTSLEPQIAERLNAGYRQLNKKSHKKDSAQ